MAFRSGEGTHMWSITLNEVSLAQIRLGVFIHFYSPGSDTGSLGSFWDLRNLSCHPLWMCMIFPCGRHLKNIPVIELTYGFETNLNPYTIPQQVHKHKGTDTHSYLSGCCASSPFSLQCHRIVILHLCDSIIGDQCLEQEYLYFFFFFLKCSI